MSFDEQDLRRALEARSGEVTPEYRARLNQAAAEPRPASGWMAAVAVLVVTLLTATSVGVLLAARHARVSTGPTASGPRVTSPSPSPLPTQGTVKLSAPSANVVWALAGDQALYRSTDQGVHWELRALPNDRGVRPSISFIDESEGWLLAPGSPTTQCEEAIAAIWHTTDGAKTWQRLQTAGLGTAQCKELIYFADRGHGFVTAWDDNHQPTVYWSNDLGVGWKHATLPDNPIFVTKPGGFTLRVDWVKSFGGTVYLEASGTQSDPTWPRDFIYTSTNGGVTWTWKQKTASPYTVMVTESRWLQLAPDVEETVNGGQAFGPYASDFHQAAPQAVFADSQVGYSSEDGGLVRTLDGGAHWTAVMPGAAQSTPSPTPSQIPMPTDAQLSAPSTNVVWALVASSRLFRSTDQGATWQERKWVPYQGGGGAPVISFVDDRNGWALFPGVPATQCLQSGAQLWRTSDGAATWRVVATVTDKTQEPKGLPFAQCKEYMAFADSLNGFVAGHDTTFHPIISRTNDGGLTWARSTLPDPPGFVSAGGNALRVVTMRSFGDIVLAVAFSGAGPAYAFRSTDAGAHWSYLDAVPQGSLNVALVTETRWLLIGNDGSGQETTDGGKSWHPWTSGYQDAAGVASTFVFADANIGYGTVRGGIQRTNDGGRRWSMIKTPGT